MNTKQIINEALVMLKSNEPLKVIELINNTRNIDLNNVDLLLIKGISFMRLEKLDDALLNFKKIISINSNYSDAYFNISAVYKKKNNLHEALKYLDKLTIIDKKNFKAFSNKCFIKIILRDFEGALTDINIAIKLNDKYLNAYLQRGNIYKELKYFDKSESDYNFIINSAEKNSNIYYDSKYNKSQLLLLKGFFKEGFKLYENRFYLNEYTSANITHPGKVMSSLNNIEKKTILVLGEQGIGDNIQFLRYLDLLKTKCAKLLLCVDKIMKPFFKKINIVDKVFDNYDKIDHFDFHIKIMSLPYLFNTDHSNIPDITFKIKPDIDKYNQWVKLLEPYKDFYKVGINTTANPNIPGKNLPLELFEKICKYKKIKIFSLQKNFNKQEFDDKKIPIINFDNFDKYELFQDSKALIKKLDLVITSDTSIAHLAACMNKETWVILNDVPDWRWLMNTTKSLWYKKIKLIRCLAKDDWTEPKKEIENLLSKYH